MHIKDIVNYVKNEINFSREFCEDNIFVTLRIEPIERIIENLEQKDRDNVSYAEDLVQAEAKANKHDSLVEKIEKKIEKLKHEPLKIKENNKFYYETDAYNKIVTQVLQELLDTEKEEV